MDKYLILIDNAWFEAYLTKEEALKVKECLSGDLSTTHKVKLTDGELVDVRMVKDIKRADFTVTQVVIHLNKEEFKTITDCMNFKLENWEDVEKDNEYRLSDGTIFKTKEEFDKHYFNIPGFKYETSIDEDMILKVEVELCEDFGHHGYINHSLYTNKGELLIHNNAKYEIQDLLTGLGFSEDEGFYNDNEIFEITDLGKERLSKAAYIIKFKSL